MASIIKSDNGVSSGITGIVQSADSSGQLALQTTTSSGTATTAVTIDNTQVATFANTLKAPNLQGPAFSVYLSASQTVTSTSFTKVAFNTKQFDTNTNFDTVTNYRFTPTIAGYYQLNAAIYASATAQTNGAIQFWKNGALYTNGSAISASGNNQCINGSVIMYLNGSTDYVELYGRVDGTGTCQFQGGALYLTQFSGVMVRSS
jgi:hypothetical protein